MITFSEFERLAAQGYNRIPLVSQVFADLDTPLSLYLKLTQSAEGAQRSFLLESVVGGERFGRYSFIGLPARIWLEARGFGEAACTQVFQDGQVIETLPGNPLDAVAAYKARFRVPELPQLPRFCGGLAGYFGYDTVRHIEKKLAHSCPPDDVGLPDICLLQTEEVAVVDNLLGRLSLIVYADPAQDGAYERARDRLHSLHARLSQAVQAPALGGYAPTEVQRPVSQAQVEAAVDEAKQLIAAGEFMQVVIGQRLQKPFAAPPLALYRALRSLNPSPYMYYYDLGDHHVVGASPEILVRQEQTLKGKKVTIRPLAGTRPRGATAEADLTAEQELLADPKERAEHVMLIDLARNDIGRIAQIGSVQVTEQFGVERYSHVMHIVSNVEGILREGLDNMDVLRACFPAGTLSGAPKVHAMEIIDRLERHKRGVYGGACGYLSFAGDMDVAIAIRTAVIKDQMLYVAAAAGVVADSVPTLEWQETEHKARAILRAAELVEQGLE